MMNAKEAEALVTKFTRNMPISTMALSYLMEKGSATVKEASEEEYAAAIDAEIKRAEANGGLSLLSKDVALSMFRYAKELAEVDPIDLITVIGNSVFLDRYLEMRYGEGAFLLTCACPNCGSSVFFRDEDDCEVLICSNCGEHMRKEQDD